MGWLLHYYHRSTKIIDGIVNFSIVCALYFILLINSQAIAEVTVIKIGKLV